MPSATTSPDGSGQHAPAPAQPCRRGPGHRAAHGLAGRPFCHALLFRNPGSRSIQPPQSLPPPHSRRRMQMPRGGMSLPARHAFGRRAGRGTDTPRHLRGTLQVGGLERRATSYEVYFSSFPAREQGDRPRRAEKSAGSRHEGPGRSTITFNFAGRAFRGPETDDGEKRSVSRPGRGGGCETPPVTAVVGRRRGFAFRNKFKQVQPASVPWPGGPDEGRRFESSAGDGRLRRTE